MPTRRTVLSGIALTTGAMLTRTLPALAEGSGEATPADIAAGAALSEAAILRDPMRPVCHLLPARNWMNDPCAPIYWKGRYHIFFQYNPHSSVWGDMHWAHASSPDMVHWQREPVALAPTPGSADAGGCFTGTAAVLDGKPTFLYTGVIYVSAEQATLRDGTSKLKESQCLAIAEDDTLRTWRKLAAPVIPAPPPGMVVTGFRDPSPWRAGDHWYCIVGSGERRVGGCVLLYRSADMRTWQYLHPLAQGKWGGKTGANPVDTGEMWECPDFFPLDGKHVFIHSDEGRTAWQIGTLDTAAMLFHAEQSGVLDHGAYYAPKTQLDAHGNRILWGWIQETRTQAAFARAGWSGMMALPRQLSIVDGQLGMQPAADVALLRGAMRTGAATRHIPTAAQELRLQLVPGAAPMAEQSFVDGRGALLLLRNPADQAPGTVRVGDTELKVPADAPLDLHMYFDHSAMELFVNQRHAVTRRYYGRTAMEPAVAITLGGKWSVQQQQAWTLKPIW